MLQTPKPDMHHSSKATPLLRPGKNVERMHQNEHINQHQDDGFTALSAGKFFEKCKLIDYQGVGSP